MIEIDRTACRGHGICAGLFPEAITLDEWGYPIIGELDSVRDEKEAAAACPVLALRVSRGEHPKLKPAADSTA